MIFFREEGYWASSLNHAKAYIQFSLEGVIRASFLAASSREWRWAWYGCTHTTARPNANSPSIALSGKKRRKANFLWNLLASPTPLCEKGQKHPPSYESWHKLWQEGTDIVTSPECQGGLLPQSWIFGIIGIVTCYGCKERVIVGYRSVVDKYLGRHQLRCLDVFPQILSASRKCPDVRWACQIELLLTFITLINQFDNKQELIC